jgi:ubiquinone/menaquinone biosynthesis C-methylase UbiE
MINPEDRAVGGTLGDEADRIRAVFEARDQRRSTGWLTSGSQFLTDERWRCLEEILRRELPRMPTPSILDIGCGGGLDLAHWRDAGWPARQLTGIDLVPGRVEAARLRCPEADIRLGGAGPLPFPSGAFDVATAATVFSSIRSAAARQALFDEMRRVVRPGGLLIVYDFVVRNPRNPNVVAMTGRRLVEMAGQPPTRSERVSPFLYGVSLGLRLHPIVGRVVASIAPRTHRLSYWRVGRGT